MYNVSDKLIYWIRPYGQERYISLSLYGQWLGYPSHCTITILTYTSKSRIVFCSGPLIGYDINNMYESLQHVRMVKIFLCGH